MGGQSGGGSSIDFKELFGAGVEFRERWPDYMPRTRYGVVYDDDNRYNTPYCILYKKFYSPSSSRIPGITVDKYNEVRVSCKVDLLDLVTRLQRQSPSIV